MIDNHATFGTTTGYSVFTIQKVTYVRYNLEELKLLNERKEYII